MQLNSDYVPVTLDDAVKCLFEALTPQDKRELETIDGSVALHMGLGTAIRNDWSMWDEDTKIREWFKTTYQINHPDDISGLILHCMLADFKNRSREIEKTVAEIHKHYLDTIGKIMP